MKLGGWTRAAVLVVWTAFFIWLWASGEVFRYIGPRTRWVVVVGAVMLGLAAGAQIVSLLRAPDRFSRIGVQPSAVVFLALPLLVLIAVPEPSLGSDAAGKRSSGAIGAFAPVADPDGEISFPEIQYASEAPEYAARAGISEGLEVELVGFVTHPEGAPEGTLSLTRFATFCCAADAVPYHVPVTGAEAFPDDTWLKVTGSLVSLEGRWAIEAERVSVTEEPRNPYI